MSWLILFLTFALHNNTILLALQSSLDSHKLGLPSVNPVPYALSPTYLQFLAKQERKIYSAMKDYTKALEARLQLIKRYTNDYEESSISGTSHLESSTTTDELRDEIVASNPILSYRMLSRYANEFISIGKNIAENAERVSSEIVYEAKGTYDFPAYTDAGDAIEAILRMQFTYDLAAHDIANGNIPGVKETVGLTPHQCYQISKTAQTNQFYTLALDWLNVTMTKFINYPNKAELDWNDKTLQSEILETVTEHNRHFKENYEDGYEHIYSKQIRSLDGPKPTSLRNQLLQQYSKLRLNESDPDYFQSIYVNHIDICNGANFQTEQEKKMLRCWYDKMRNLYWTISPLKIEIVNIDPPVVQIYDIISDKWISYLKTLASPELERAPSGPNATPRTAAYAWFKDSEILETHLSRRIEFITGLNVVGDKASESLQIAAYAFGGHVELHYDSKGPDDPKPDPKGDRVTTFLIYLNNVENGGLTSFPKLGFSVKPIKGSAVLWYTNLRNGEVDPKTLHGACPLIYGHKWIATKWTHINENILKRPCGLTPSQ